MQKTSSQLLFGLVAEFDTPDKLMAAARSTRSAGYQHAEAYTPYPIEGLTEALGHHHTPLPWIVLGGGIFGALAGFGLQYWAEVIEYPKIIGGRPFNSWPAFIPITFEMTILLASFAAVLGMLALNGLPQPHHPLFNVERFARATRDRYFLCIAAADKQFDENATRSFLQGLNPIEVSDVEH